jgi:Uncharacterised nucleotidyltransferase
LAASSWRFELDPVVGWIAASGLSTELAAPIRPLDAEAWTRVRDGATHHRLDGLLVAAVGSGRLPTDPGQCREAAALEIDLTRARMALERRTADEVEWFASLGIEVRLLKGSALAHLDYPDPQLRPTSDIDLLVRSGQLDEAIVRLEERGARRSDPDPVPGYAAVAGKGATMVMEGALEIDLHRLLVWGPLGVRLRAEDLWSTSRTFVLDGRSVTGLGVEEALLHAAYHLVVSGWRRALSLRDVGQLLAAPGLDAERAIGLARRWGAEAVLASAIAAAVGQLALIEQGALTDWAGGYRPTWRDRLWLRIDRPEDHLAGFESVATFLELRTRAERSMFLSATTRPAPGTWPTPGQRVGALTRRVVGRTRVGD